MRRALLAGAVAAILATAGCGQTDANISREASAVLAPQVSAIRSAAVGENRTQAARELTSLRESVAELTRTGKLSQDSARKILDAAAEVEDNLDLIPTRQAPPPVRRQSPAKAPEPTRPPPSPAAPATPPPPPSPVGQPSPVEKGGSGEPGKDSGQDGGQQQQSPSDNDEQSSSQSQGDTSALDGEAGVAITGPTD
jgi:outer membrane biosynthesis protein TonB